MLTTWPPQYWPSCWTPPSPAWSDGWSCPAVPASGLSSPSLEPPPASTADHMKLLPCWKSHGWPVGGEGRGWLFYQKALMTSWLYISSQVYQQRNSDYQQSLEWKRHQCLYEISSGTSVGRKLDTQTHHNTALKRLYKAGKINNVEHPPLSICTSWCHKQIHEQKKPNNLKSEVISTTHRGRSTNHHHHSPIITLMTSLCHCIRLKSRKTTFGPLELQWFSNTLLSLLVKTHSFF